MAVAEDLAAVSDLPACVFQTSTGKSFSVVALFESEMDVAFYRHGGVLRYVASGMLQ